MYMAAEGRTKSIKKNVINKLKLNKRFGIKMFLKFLITLR